MEKILSNYRDAYNYKDEWEISVLELIANSIDAKASEIKITVKKKEYNKIDLICEDNGIGMNEEEFEEYHNLGSLTKTKGGTIGFAGIGAKLTIDLCDFVYTETKKKRVYLASKWKYDNFKDEPYYELIPPENKLSYKHGTYVKIVGLKANGYSIERMIDVIYSNYQYLLDKINLYLQNEKLKSPIEFLTKNSKQQYKISRKSPKKKIKYTLVAFYLRDDSLNAVKKYYEEVLHAPNAFKSWFDIVVYGKTVKREVNFNLHINVPADKWDLITGYIECNDLMPIVKVSKDDLNTAPGMWTAFVNLVKKEIAKWLSDLGIYRDPMLSSKKNDVEVIVKKLEKDINELLKNNPDILEKLTLGKPLSSKGKGDIPPVADDEQSIKEEVLVPDSSGSEEGLLMSGGELGRGTHGGEGTSEGPQVPHEGENPNIESPYLPDTDEVEDRPLIKTSTKTIRGRRYKIGIAWAELPLQKTVEWFPEQNVFVINSSHPAAILAYNSGIETMAFYTVHEIIKYIVDNYLTDEENRDNAFWKLYEEYINMLS